MLAIGDAIGLGNLLIMGKSKRVEEREFYLRLATREKWPSRQLERQIDSALFERVVLSPAKLSASLRVLHPQAADIFKDAYVVEFLQLPDGHLEADLHRGLLTKLKDFLIELGRDFCFAGSEYPIQVGGKDFALDLLFFHRGLPPQSKVGAQPELDFIKKFCFSDSLK